jgi:site-specific DNA-methyltransferase (adenine-specific)
MELDALDFDISIAGFDINDFDLDEGSIEFQEDDYDVEESFPEKPKAKLGDIYQLGNHRLMCGDSTSQEDIDKLVDGAVMDLCVTDPPYNVNYGSINDNGYGKERNNGNKILNDNMDDTSFYLFLKAMYTQMIRVLKEGGAYYIFHADTEGYNFRKALMDAGGQVKQNLIWVKNALVLGRQDYQWKHEPCLYGWKEGAGHYFINKRNQTTVFEDGLNLDELTEDELKEVIKELLEDKFPSTIIHENKPAINDVHPTMKPIKLISRLVKNSSRQGENVIDFFGGSGSTLISCEKLKRNCYTIELDPKYVDVIINRWEELTGKKAVKLN